MNKTIFNFVLDVLLLINFLVLVWVSCVLRFAFPPPTSADEFRLWGINYNGWSEFGFLLLALIVLGILVHVMMHWSWVCGVIATKLLGIKAKADDAAQTLYGVGFLMAILLVFAAGLLAAKVSVQSPLAL